jgi:hypothetical protein
MKKYKRSADVSIIFLAIVERERKGKLGNRKNRNMPY